MKIHEEKTTSPPAFLATIQHQDAKNMAIPGFNNVARIAQGEKKERMQESKRPVKVQEKKKKPTGKKLNVAKICNPATRHLQQKKKETRKEEMRQTEEMGKTSRCKRLIFTHWHAPPNRLCTGCRERS